MRIRFAFALLLISCASRADNGDPYPAAYFQPKVIYSAEAANPAVLPSKQEARPNGGQDSDSQYPAADFQPKVIYLDKQLSNEK